MGLIKSRCEVRTALRGCKPPVAGSKAGAKLLGARNIMANTIMDCNICGKQLIRGDYVYGACHPCARQAINKASTKGNGGYARLLDTGPKFEGFVRGYIAKAG